MYSRTTSIPKGYAGIRTGNRKSSTFSMTARSPSSATQRYPFIIRLIASIENIVESGVAWEIKMPQL